MEEVEEDYDDDMVDKDYMESGNDADTSDDEEALSKVWYLHNTFLFIYLSLKEPKLRIGLLYSKL
jgi:hypothetical protein